MLGAGARKGAIDVVASGFDRDADSGGVTWGVALTGWNTEAYGVAETGDWVSDGMSFHLVDRGGSVLAATLVKVRCGESMAPWLPLDLGNEWIYFTKTR